MSLISARAQLCISADLGLSGLTYISVLGRLLADLVWPWLGRLGQLCSSLCLTLQQANPGIASRVQRQSKSRRGNRQGLQRPSLGVVSYCSVGQSTSHGVEKYTSPFCEQLQKSYGKRYG